MKQTELNTYQMRSCSHNLVSIYVVDAKSNCNFTKLSMSRGDSNRYALGVIIMLHDCRFH